MGADEPMLGEAAGKLTVKLIPARRVMDEDNARVRTSAVGSGNVGVDLVAAATGDPRHARDHAALSVRAERVPHTSSLIARPVLGQSIVEEVDLVSRLIRPPGMRH